MHFNTVYTWCRKAERGLPSRLRTVERDPDNGYFYIDLDEVLEMRAEKARRLLSEILL